MPKRLFIAVTIMVVLTFVLRVVIDIPNFTPIGALALLCGATIKRKTIAVAAPLVALALSDLFFGWHNLVWAVYLSYAAIVFFGGLIKNTKDPVSLTKAAFGSAVFFYATTNFAVWLVSGLYPATLSGLIASYVAGLPFLHLSVLGNVLFTGIYFGLYHKWKTATDQTILQPLQNQ